MRLHGGADGDSSSEVPASAAVPSSDYVHSGAARIREVRRGQHALPVMSCFCAVAGHCAERVDLADVCVVLSLTGHSLAGGEECQARRKALRHGNESLRCGVLASLPPPSPTPRACSFSGRESSCPTGGSTIPLTVSMCHRRASASSGAGWAASLAVDADRMVVGTKEGAVQLLDLGA